MNICDERQCTGCFACYNACPVKCISMSEDLLGHLHPVINPKLCVQCGICKKICPNNQNLNFNTIQAVYAAWSNDDQDRATSTSGGAASVFSSYIVRNNGIVFGAAINDSFGVEHKGVNQERELFELKGSKYVQSHINKAYEEVLSFLELDKKVLFTGTPCQIAGLKTFLKKDYDNLYTVDLICHGVPSQKMLQEHVKNVLGTNNLEKLKFSFRDSNKYFLKIYLNDEEVYSASNVKDLYYMAFWNTLSLRESCYSCKYAQAKRISDITIGDFWGLDPVNSEHFSHEKGISCILINTEKGRTLFNAVSNNFCYTERKIQEVIDGNTQLQHPSIKHKNNERLKLLIRAGESFDDALKACLKKEILKQKIKDIDTITHVPIIASLSKIGRMIFSK